MSAALTAGWLLEVWVTITANEICGEAFTAKSTSIRSISHCSCVDSFGNKSGNRKMKNY